jgi:recombination protein RecA
MARRNRRKQLDAALATIRLRFGQGAIGPLSDQAKFPEVATIPTGFPKLDRLLGIGGIPRSRITELLGAPTAGMATLAYKILTGTQKERLTYIDLLSAVPV